MEAKHFTTIPIGNRCLDVNLIDQMAIAKSKSHWHFHPSLECVQEVFQSIARQKNVQCHFFANKIQ